MKNLKVLKIVLLFYIIISVLSCKNDGNDLIGKWQRSDFNDAFEYKFIFNADSTGYRTQREGKLKTQGISNAIMFDWRTNENILTLDYYGEIVTTTFSINSEGQLFLSDLTNLYFIKLEE